MSVRAARVGLCACPGGDGCSTGSAAPLSRPPLSRAELAHAILDAMERAGANYYRLNHATHDQIGDLADLVAGWCRRVGIPVE